jgi:putative addiction module killer protein
MLEVRQTEIFSRWLGGLKDRIAKARIVSRIRRLAHDGHFGDVKYFDGIGEMRIDHGPGYRAYFVMQGETVVFLLCGGDKSSQRRDIERARQMAKEL